MTSPPRCFPWLHPTDRGPRLTAGGTEALPSRGTVDSLNKALNQLSENPIVQLLIFVVMFVLRLEADQWHRRRAERKARKAKKAANA